MSARTHDSRAFRILTIMDEYTMECLDITVDRGITAQAVIHKLADLFISRGIPEHIRSDNGPQFTARAVRKWLRDLRVRSLYIEPGSPWENGYIESFNGRLMDELLNGEILMTPFEATAPIENWR
jgi:transposase InsO family protein